VEGEYSLARSNMNLYFVPFIFSVFVDVMNLSARIEEIRRHLLVLNGEVLTDILVIKWS
jgi:hypothetical protein